MRNQNWVYMDGYDEVRTAETHELVFKTDEVESNEVIDKVVTMHNECKTWSEIDDYLLDECLCTSDEREIILESAYKNYYSKLPLQKL